MESANPVFMPRKNAFKDIFSPYAPPHDLPFPDHANFTAYELLAFLPNSIQSVDVIYRFTSNGATRRAIWSIINTARDLPKEWSANQCGVAVTRTMNDSGFEGWTMTMHDLWHAPNTNWDETRLDVTGYRTPENMQGEPNGAENIPFKSLAKSVRRLPQDDDALDLTRMVHYCLQNPADEWMYPRDYNQLLNMIGGPILIREGHHDRAAFRRWDGTKPPPARVWSAEEQDMAKIVLEAKNTKEKIDNPRVRRSMSKQQSRDSTPNVAGQRKTRGRPAKRTRFEVIDLEEEKMEEDEAETSHEPYVRRPAEYVVPPDGVEQPKSIAVAVAFAAEHNLGETDMFSAYAFGGPRHRPPYRMLHDIQQPDQADVSGWAENLRWAFEQRACFWHAVQTEGWNESPAHMELIAQTRQKQVWASEELLELLPDD
jgi:hypothetical protein